ncbi:ABC transporter ATP-binding protein [Halorussus halobius]|uniref:ABC transporter ATP-binding protein n=1 Tax=Halorussus halobius TaxID=1710537 RepID=UPI001092EFF1|nr:ABC transporter ATP-binding protein [Halorussus halobius]
MTTRHPPTDRRDDRTAVSAEPFVSVRNLTTYYHDSSMLSSQPPVKAVDGVSFDVREGETVGLVGESGCGKTTLGRTILGLESPTDGTVLSRGEDVTDLDAAERGEWVRKTGMVFQDPEESLNERMTVGEIVREPLDAHEWQTPDEREQRVRELLERVGLNEEHFYRYPHQFSGGQRQRVGIARALALEPEFLVLDEPVSALDVSVQARIINLLEDLQTELGLSYLFIAHDLSVVRHIADRVAVMYLGNVVEMGPTERVFADPRHPYTVSLLSAIPGSASPWTGDRITLRGTPPNPRHPPSGCPFTTRCPAKIRPDEYDLDEDAWRALDALRSVFRTRSRDPPTLLDRAKRVLGRETVDDTVRAAVDDHVGDADLPDEVRAIVDEAVELARGGEYRAAADRLAASLGSRCDAEHPEFHRSDRRRSACHRAEPGYDDVRTTLERRHASAADGRPNDRRGADG